MGSALFYIIDSLIGLIMFVVIAMAIISWLVAFDVLNTRNPTVNRILSVLDAITDPLLRPIRRFLPNLGGIDVSPIILLIALRALQILLHNTIEAPLKAALG